MAKARGNRVVGPLAVVLATVAVFYRVDPSSKGAANAAHSFLNLSYPLTKDDAQIPSSARNRSSQAQYFGKGSADFLFVIYYALILCCLRHFSMQWILQPFAAKVGLNSKRRQHRFMEQVYTACYFSIFGPLGFYIMTRSPVALFETSAMYDSFPVRSHVALFKAYYLLQASYWLHQLVVMILQLEARRKDYHELVIHHILTLTLIWLSYRFHFTYIGIVIFVTHDISDFFLATSLILSYVKSRFVVPYFFGFIFIWIYLRHYVNLQVLYSISTEFATIGPFKLNWETQQYKCWISQYITFTLLLLLQILNLIWLFYIMRIGYNAVFHGSKRDIRSDDEQPEEET